MEDIKQEKQKMRASTKWAIVVTVIWLGGIAAYVIFKWDKFLTMEPNAVGDFLAGTMSPLALFWLVAGYRQQGEELEQNTKALLLQQIEMQNQVKEFKKLAIHAEEQAASSQVMAEVGEKERRAREVAQIVAMQPIFDISPTNTFYDDDVEYIIKNSGKPARNVSISSDSYESCNSDIPFKFDAVDACLFSLHRLKPGCDKRNFILNIEYTDVQAYVKKQSFVVVDFNVYPKDFYHVGRVGE